MLGDQPKEESSSKAYHPRFFAIFCPVFLAGIMVALFSEGLRFVRRPPQSALVPTSACLSACLPACLLFSPMYVKDRHRRRRPQQQNNNNKVIMPEWTGAKNAGTIDFNSDSSAASSPATTPRDQVQPPPAEAPTPPPRPTATPAAAAAAPTVGFPLPAPPSTHAPTPPRPPRGATRSPAVAPPSEVAMTNAAADALAGAPAEPAPKEKQQQPPPPPSPPPPPRPQEAAPGATAKKTWPAAAAAGGAGVASGVSPAPATAAKMTVSRASRKPVQGKGTPARRRRERKSKTVTPSGGGAGGVAAAAPAPAPITPAESPRPRPSSPGPARPTGPPRIGALARRLLDVEVVKAAGLLGLERGGVSDPRAEVFLVDLGGRVVQSEGVKKSAVARGTTNPIWNHKVTFGQRTNLSTPAGGNMPTLRVQVCVYFVVRMFDFFRVLSERAGVRGFRHVSVARRFPRFSCLPCACRSCLVVDQPRRQHTLQLVGGAPATHVMSYRSSS